MKRCTAVCMRLASQPRRWVSYDKSALTPEALLKQAESGLGYDADGNPLKIDVDAKTVNTAAGALPISPVMDPDWMKARRREKKMEPGRPQGQFRKRLANNPYALALATPIRKCQNTGVFMPRFFFQDLELVKHPDPEEKKAWWAPGPLSFMKAPRPRGGERISDAPDPLVAEKSSSETSTSEKLILKEPAASEDTSVHADKGINNDANRRSPFTTYILGRKEALEIVAKGKSGRKYLGALLKLRTGSLALPEMDDTVWRDGMGDAILKMLRRQVVDALLDRANAPNHRFLQRCASWDEIKKVSHRGCVLWLPAESKGAGSQYATMDLDTKDGAKMAVHDLEWLLGEEEVARLKQGSEMFRDSEVLVLKQDRSRNMISLHQLLWRLQGFLEPQQSIDTKET